MAELQRDDESMLETKALLELHYGSAFKADDSDSESVVTGASHDSNFEKYRPPPYSYEEIKSQLMVVKAAPSPAEKNVMEASKSGDSSKEKELLNLMRLDYCYICDATLLIPQNVFEHYNSKNHKHLVTYRYGSELHEKSKALILQENSDVNEAIIHKLKSLTQPFYCHVCQTELQSSSDGISHYNSKKHGKKVKHWQELELEKVLKSQKNVECYEDISTSTAKSNIELNKKEEHSTNNSTTTSDTGILNINNNSTSPNIGSKDINKEEGMIIKPTYYGLCGIDLQQTDTVTSHYNSKQHADAVRLWHTKYDMNKIQRSQKESIENGFEIPGLETPKKQLILDYHEDLTKDFSQDLKKRLFILLTSHHCSVCNTVLQDTNSAASHYISKRHGRRVTLWHDEVKSSSPDESVQSNKDLHSSQSSLNGDTSSETSYCHLCRVTFYTKMNQHVSSFVHQQLLKLALTLIKRGTLIHHQLLGLPLQVYWFKLFAKLVSDRRCQLCNLNFATNDVAVLHSNGHYHKNQVDYWIQQHEHYANEAASDVITRHVCYCETCEKDLDGTTRTTKHYAGLIHQKLLTTYCSTCELQLRITSKYQQHIKSSSHCNKASEKSEQNQTDIKVQTRNDNNKDVNELQMKRDGFKKSLNDSIANLHEDVSDELRKLADALYYSKKIPLEEALEYLKKFNKEIEEVTAKFKKKADDESTEESNKSDLRGNEDATNCEQHVTTIYSTENPKEKPNPDHIQEVNVLKPNDNIDHCGSLQTEDISSIKAAKSTVESVETVVADGKDSKDTAQNTMPKSVTELPIDETAIELENKVLVELERLLNSVRNSDLEQSVIKSCLVSFNRQLSQHLE